MKKEEFIIEVKTKWIMDENEYIRTIIEYTCPYVFSDIDESIYTKYLTPSKIYTEKCQNIKGANLLEINALNMKDKKIILNPSNLIKTLLDFTKFQWTKGE